MPSQSSQRTGAAITVRGLTAELKARLRVRAAHNARSMEAEARAILESALSRRDEDAIDLGTYARRLVGPLGGVELELPPREPAREPPDFRVAKRLRRRSRR
jgi:plasmid stability protein